MGYENKLFYIDENYLKGIFFLILCNYKYNYFYIENLKINFFSF